MIRRRLIVPLAIAALGLQAGPALAQGAFPAPLPAGEATGVLLACLSQDGRLLMFPVDELKHQPKGGRGLTLMDLEGKDRLQAVATATTQLVVHGTALRGGKPKEELLRGASLQAHLGKRARKGKTVDGLKAPRRLSAG